MLYVSQLTDPDDLDQLQLVWQRLWLATRSKSFFQSLAWLRIYWRHFGGDPALKILSVESCDAPLGILPLVVRTEATTLGPLRVLSYPLADGGGFFGPIGPAPTATLVNGLRFLREGQRDWDVLELRGVNRDEVDFGRTRNAFVNARLPAQENVGRTMPVIDISKTWSDYWQTLPMDLRDNVEASTRAAKVTGELTFERWRPDDAMRGDGEPRWELFDECLSLAASEPEHELANRGAFYRDVFEAASHAGALDVNLLRLGGRLIAFRFHLHTDGVLQELLTGSRTEFSRLSPDRLLLAWTLKDSGHRRDTRLIFRETSQVQHDSWNTRNIAAYGYTHVPRTSWRGQIQRIGRRWAKRMRIGG